MTNEWIGANHSVSITMKCYEHIELPDKNAIRESLERVFGNKLNMTENALQTPDRTMSNESQQLQGLSRGMDRTASKANSKAREFENGESPQPIAVAGFHGGEGGIRTHVRLLSN